MKAHQLIRDALSDWRSVRNAPDLAHDLFADLDAEEIARLALRGLTDEVRSTLRRKDPNGVPLYTSVLAPDVEGEEPQRIYKQTALFDMNDYTVAVQFYRQEARANLRVARALVDDCLRRHGVQLQIDGITA